MGQRQEGETNVIGSQGQRRIDRLVRDHVRLAQRASAQFAARVPNHVREDLLSAAMVGLADAARLYDESRGVPFAAYALQRIRGALLDELRGLDWAGRALRDKGRRFDRITESLTAGLGRHPTEGEVAEAAGVSTSDVRKLTNDLHRVVVSLDNVASGDANLIARNAEDDPEERALRHEQVTFLGTAIRALPRRSQTVVRQYFLEGRSMADIARELDVSIARVSQIRAEALELLRDGMNVQLDPDSITPLRATLGRVSRRAEYRATLAKVG